MKPLILLESLKKAYQYITFGQYHVASLHFPIIFCTTTIAVLLFVKEKEIPRQCLILLSGLGLIATLVGFYHWAPLENLKSQYIPFLLTFQLDRFYFLGPVFWYLLFAQILIWLQQWRLTAKTIPMFLIALQIIFIFTQHPEVVALRSPDTSPSLEQFFARDLFEKILNDIDLPDNTYHVASLGMHPSIAAVNGLHTIDGYANMYPLSYKHTFGQLIEPELNKSPVLYKSFHKWGSRCYIFSSELGYNFMFGKIQDRQVKNLTLNTDILAALGCNYIISAVEIVNPNRNKLTLIGEYSTTASYWHLFLYKYEPDSKHS